MADETSVGAIVAYLRMDDTDFTRTIAAAKAEADDLGKTSPSVRISTNSTEVIAQLAAVRAAEDEVGSGLNRSGSSFSRYRSTIVGALDDIGKAGKSIDFGSSTDPSSLAGSPKIFAGIAAGAVLAGPAVAAATGAVVGFAGAVGTAFLAYKGFQTQMSEGTVLGGALKSSLSGITTEFDHLELVAATGASAGVLGALSKVKAFIPSLEPVIGNLSTHLGNALNISAGGVIEALKTVEPLLDDVGVYAEHLAQSFANFAGSKDFKNFIAYARDEMPKVGSALMDTGEALVHIATALHPAGDAAISTIQGISAAINALHVEKLTALASFFEGQTGGALGELSKGFGILVNPIGTVNDAFQKLKGHTKELTDEQKVQLGVQKLAIASYDNVATATGLASGTVQNYANLIGITSDQVSKGSVSYARMVAQIGEVKTVFNTATVTGSAFLQTLQQFSVSAGTASDRASLISATLKAANGDALAYGAAVAGTTTANHALTGTFQDQAKNIADLRKQIASGTLDTQGLADANDQLTTALSTSELAAINLKTGVIDYTKQGAGPLIASLQGIQDAALSAAAATYQHELSTRGATKASDDAYQLYVTQTRGSLIDEATQLGLTKDQAKKLADQYFGMPGDVKTKIEQEGGDTVTKLLTEIDTWLHRIADPAWAAKVDAETEAAKTKTTALTTQLEALGARTFWPGVSIGGTWQDDLRAVTASLNGLGSTTYHPGVSIGAPKRAAGGPVSKGQPYVVGEMRPELFVPDSNGTIIPEVPASVGTAKASLTNAPANAGQFGAKVTIAPVINVNAAPGMDEKKLSDLVGQRVSAEFSGLANEVIYGRKS